MRDLVDDEVLATFAVVAGPEDVAARGAPALRRAGRPVQRLRLLPRAARPLGSAGRRLPLTLDARTRPRASGILVLGIIVSNEEIRRRAPRPQHRRPRRAGRCWPSSASRPAPTARGDRAGRRRERRSGRLPRARSSTSSVSVGQWGDLVRTLGGDCATVTTIVASGAVDPHDFEPGTADLAAFSERRPGRASTAPATTTGPQDAVATLDPAPAVVERGRRSSASRRRAPTRTSGTSRTSCTPMADGA